MGLSAGIIKEAAKRLGLPADLPADLEQRLRKVLNEILDEREVQITVSFPKKEV